MKRRALKAVDEQSAPEAFLIPTALLVDVLKLVGETPSKHGGRIFTELQKLKPTDARPE